MSNLEHNKVIDALNIWSNILLRSTKETKYELSSRQVLVLLHVYLTDPPHSIKSLTEVLGFSKAATCRAVDYLCEEGLVKRKRDTEDKRNVLINRSIAGLVYLSEMATIIQQETAQKPLAEAA